MPDVRSSYADHGAALIGDVVASRAHPDRLALQGRLSRAMATASEAQQVTQPLHLTLGDEFQGVAASLPAAVRLGLDLRLDLLPEVEVRIGVGLGAFRVFDAAAAPVAQDGPAWWAARAAVDTAKRLGGRPGTRHIRTWTQVLPGDGRLPADEDGPGAVAESVVAVNAFLGLQDFVLSTMRKRELRLLAATLRGEPQREMARREQITQSAVSQALQSSGARALVHCLEVLQHQSRAHDREESGRD